MHDIGKSLLESELVEYTGTFSEDQFEEMKRHTVLGYDLLDSQNAYSPLTLSVVRSHHERSDGTGYPDGLEGNQINPLINGIRAEVRRWRPTKIGVQIPANAQTGDVEVRLASSDPLPDGSCCAPVEYALSNTMPLTVIPPIAYDPQLGPVGSKVVLSGQGFGETAPKDGRVFFGGKLAAIAQWTDRTIVIHVPLNAESGPLVLHRDGQDRTIGNFDVVTTEVNEYFPKRGPIGTLIIIRGKNFGIHSEGGDTAYAFDFQAANNGVSIGGIPAVIHRWLDDQIDVWVPFSAKSGPIVVKRGGGIPNADGTCCERKEVVKYVAGEFTVVRPEIHDYSPKEGGLDEIVTLEAMGASIESGMDVESAGASAFVLKKDKDHVIRLLFEILKTPNFEKEKLKLEKGEAVVQ